MCDSRGNDPKNNLRRAMREMLRARSTPPPNLVPALAAWLEANPERQIIGVFAPLPGEPDLMPLTTSFPRLRWCFPRVMTNDQLGFHAVDDPSRDLKPAAFGILEPAADAAMMPIDQIDAFVCPGLAFDRQGGRLGRGLGYYDKALAMARGDAVKIGACFTDQIVATTFPEPHDIPMDLLACEHGVLTIAAAPA